VPVHQEYVEYLMELLRPLGGISHRSMFGGVGIYKHGTIFAIVIDDVLYLKADDKNRAEFESLGLEPFSYEAAGKKKVSMSYHRCPDEALESASEMRRWALSAYAAALRKGKSAAKKPPAKKTAIKKPPLRK
jgi:DNA transformation protein and related proteins